MGFETEAFAIANVMKYIRPPVNTVAIGQAFGAAAMILSQGEVAEYHNSIESAQVAGACVEWV